MSKQYSRFCPHINHPSAVCSIMQMQNRLCTLCCKEHYANPEQYNRCWFKRQTDYPVPFERVIYGNYFPFSTYSTIHDNS
ncbi:MAG: hypothetical protein LBH79_07010 [Nitrososphaerota archaeon]|nr:hypothetical protein [Nitrososphaerota archaeon]